MEWEDRHLSAVCYRPGDKLSGTVMANKKGTENCQPISHPDVVIVYPGIECWELGEGRDVGVTIRSILCPQEMKIKWKN